MSLTLPRNPWSQLAASAIPSPVLALMGVHRSVSGICGVHEGGPFATGAGPSATLGLSAQGSTEQMQQGGSTLAASQQFGSAL